MQGSFWKTVAVVGVIGIGSLAILEVQNRLPQQSATVDDGEAAEMLKQAAATGDQTVDAVMTDSELDKLLKGESGLEDPAADLVASFSGMQEPTVAANAQTTADVSAEFHSEPVTAQPAFPPVDTTVRVEELATGGNPFAEEAASTTVAAKYEATESGGVAPAGFAQLNAPEPKQPSQPDSSGQPVESSEFAEFTAFADDGQAAPNTLPASETKTLKTDAKDTAGKIAFFSSGGTENADQPAADTEPKTVAQFYTEDTPSNADAPVFDNQAPAFESDEPEMQPSADDSQPATEPGREFPAFTDDNSDPVPFPEDPQSTPQPAPDSGFESEQPIERVPAGREPEEAPVREESGFGESALPFLEDDAGRTPEGNVPDLNPAGGTGGLSIPGMNDPPRDSNPAEPAFNPRSDFAPKPRTFEPEPMPERQPDKNPLPNYNEPGIRDGDESFGNMRSFEADPETERRPQPQENFERDNRQPDNREFRNREPEGQPVEEFRIDEPRRIPSVEERRFEDTPRDDLGFEPRPRELRPQPESNLDRLPEIRSRGPVTDASVSQISGTMRPNLVLEKTAPKNATVGSPLDYEIYVRNEGDATAFDVIVEDDVTSAARVDGAHPQSDFDTKARKLVWKFAEIAPGQQEKIRVQVTPTGEGVMDGMASVRFKSRVKATTVITAPKLRLQMQGKDEVRLGGEIAYRYIITNEGTGEARDVLLRTLLPADGSLKHPAGRDLEYEITAMKPGEQREILLAVVAGEPGEHKAEAEVSAAGGAADQAAWRTNVIGAQLQIVRRGPKRRYVNRAATYENIITNETNFDALDAKVVEQIPDGMRFMGATMGGQYNEATHTVTWLINRLGPGRQEQLQLELMPTVAGNMESVVKVLENVGVQSEDYVSTTVVEDLHNVKATISQLDGPVATGEPFGFTINIDNRGTADATDVALKVEVPEGIQVLGAGSEKLQARLKANNTVEYSSIIRITPGEKQSFELKLQGDRAVRNGIVKAMVQYKQMNDPLIVSESVTIYNEGL